MRAAILPLLLLGGVAAADNDAFDKLQKAIPAGWTVLETEHELVIRHDRPCYVTGQHRPNDPPPTVANPCSTDGPLITLELRFHTEQRWSQKQIDEARAANDRATEDLKRAREKHRVDAIHQSKGRPLPANAEERKRLAAYEKDESQIRARMVNTPMCVFGEYSVFDGDELYAQLKLKVDPPSAMSEAYKVLETLKKQCGAL